MKFCFSHSFPLLNVSRPWHNGVVQSGTLFRELRRRNVFKVVIAYVAITWLILEAASVFLFGFEGRSSIIFALLIIFVLGFVAAIYISWAFEATPEGMKRTENVPADVAAKLPTWSRRKFAVFIIGTALLAASLMVFDFVRSRNEPASPPPTAAP